MEEKLSQLNSTHKPSNLFPENLPFPSILICSCLSPFMKSDGAKAFWFWLIYVKYIERIFPILLPFVYINVMKWQLNVIKGNKILKPKANGPHVKWEHAWLPHNLPWNWKLCNEGDKFRLPPFTFCYVRQAYHTLILSDKEISMKQCQFAMKKWTKSISMNFSFMDLLTWVFSWYHEKS